MEKEQPEKEPERPYRLVSVTRVQRGDWPEALKRVREEVRRSERITEDDLKVFINT